MNIIYIALSCDPYNGSEDKIGWNIPYYSSKINNKIHIITRIEEKENIEKYLSIKKIDNITFHYIDIHNWQKKIYKNLLFSFRLKALNKEALKIAKMICINEKIDIIHQITPIEMRAIGDYGKIEKIKFVVGPLGGAEYIPNSLKKYAKKHIFEENLRKIMNSLTIMSYRINHKLKHCDKILYANYETMISVDKIVKQDNYCCEMGLSKEEIIKTNTKKAKSDKITFLIAGRLVYRKGHEFILDILNEVDNKLNYQVLIVGDGPEKEKIKRKILSTKNLKSKVRMLGNIDYTKMIEVYNKTDVLLFPSLRDTSGNVMLESMSKGIPVVTIDAFGGGRIVNNENGFLYSGRTYNELKSNLVEIIENIIKNKDVLMEKSKNCINDSKYYIWENKVEHYNEIYKSLLERK